ncbi:molybdopterin-binding protein [Hartmannibacter diazotrophicus]|nr:molybdopterin-binding protein [Hartmannibacter diazotrophicus]
MPVPPSVLTSLDVARKTICDGLAPVAPCHVPLSEALGLIAAATLPLPAPVPSVAQAAKDGWAVFSADIAGASSYSPVVLPQTPAWINAGDDLPANSDCVLDPGQLSDEGAFAEVFAEARPGEGTRPAGCDLPSGDSPLSAGRRIDAFDLAACRRAGIETVAVRRPKVRIVNAAGRGHDRTTCQLIKDRLDVLGALTFLEDCPNHSEEIVAAIRSAPADLCIVVGGTGFGEDDRTVEALSTSGMLLAHGLALSPGRTTATGRWEGMPIIALPGLPEQAFGGLLALVEPSIHLLAGSDGPALAMRSLARKISSTVGVSEIALLQSHGDGWMPISVSDLTLASVRRADAWALIPAASEGLGAGSPLAAALLRPRDVTGS